MSNNSNRRRARKPAPMQFTLADRLLAAGQKLRAAEVVSATTFALPFAAKWAQAVRRG